MVFQDNAEWVKKGWKEITGSVWLLCGLAAGCLIRSWKDNTYGYGYVCANNKEGRQDTCPVLALGIGLGKDKKTGNQNNHAGKNDLFPHFRYSGLMKVNCWPGSASGLLFLSF